MKKVLKPAEKEESVFYTDFKGKLCDPSEVSPIDLTIEFNYGSSYDGGKLILNLNDEEIVPILEVIKKNMSQEYRNFIKKKLEYSEKRFEDSMQMRDWDSCDRDSNSNSLLRLMLDIK